MIARLLRWIAARKRDSYRRWCRRHTLNIPAKDTVYRMGELEHYTDGTPSRDWIDAARMGGNCPSAWRGKDGK